MHGGGGQAHAWHGGGEGTTPIVLTSSGLGNAHEGNGGAYEGNELSQDRLNPFVFVCEKKYKKQSD